MSAAPPLALALALGLAAAPAAAAPLPVPVGAQFQVNADIAYTQDLPEAAARDDGGVVVVWRSSGGPGASLRARALSATGAPEGAEMQVTAHTTLGLPADPAVAVTPDGGVVVAWFARFAFGPPHANYTVQLRRLDADLAPAGDELTVESYVTGRQSQPSIAVQPGGELVVAWVSEGSFESDDDRTSIQARRLASDGTHLGGQFQVNAYTTSRQQDPSLALAPGGEVLVAWESLSRIRLRRLASSGAPVGAETVISPPPGLQDLPSIAPASPGGFQVVWRQDGTRDEITAQALRLDGDGVPAGEVWEVSDPAFQVLDLALAPLPEGGALVAWTRVPFVARGSESLGIAVAGLDSAGVPVGGERPVETYAPAIQYQPAVVATSPSSALVAWTSDGSPADDDSSTSIQARRVAILDAIFADGFETGDEGRWSAVEAG